MIKEFAFKHMKADDVKIDGELNEMIWARGLRNPPRRVKVTMEKDEDGVVTVLLPKEELAEPEAKVVDEEKKEEETREKGEEMEVKETKEGVPGEKPETSSGLEEKVAEAQTQTTGQIASKALEAEKTKPEKTQKPRGRKREGKGAGEAKEEKE
jgi:large subunit ribosomal protein L31e